MANMTLNQYLQQIQAAWEARSGTEVSELLSFKHPHVMSQKLVVENPENAVERIVESPFDELVVCHLKCLYALNQCDYVEGYRQQSLLVQLFAKVFQSQKEDNWALFIMYTISVDLRTMAVKVDQELSKKGVDKPGETLEKAAESLMGLFRVCAGDNRTSDEYTKRWGMLYLVNQLFKIYFRINKIHLCKPLIRAIEASQFKDQFSLSQQVTYKYFVGQKAMFDSDFKSAEDYLTYAFEHCHRRCRANKRLILIYLIPVKMLLGHLPSLFLLQKYDLLQFTEVVQAVREGNLLRFQKALEQHEAFFIRCGIYLILEKLKVIVYRNLFKKVSLLMKTHQIPIEAFLAALKVMQVEDVDLDETQCILANLIYENKIKGYISHSHQKLVISKQNAFPPLASVA